MKPAEVQNAESIKKLLLTELECDSTDYAVATIKRLDSIQLKTEDDAVVLYDVVNNVTRQMRFDGRENDALIISRKQLDILRNSCSRNSTDTQQMLNMYVSMGVTFSNMGMPGIALDYYTRGLEHCNDTIYDSFKAMLLNNLGIMYAERNLPGKAKNFLMSALEINLRKFNHHEAFRNYANLAELYALQKDPEKALEASQHSIDYIDQRSHPDQLATMRAQQGSIYASLNQPDLAMLRFNSALKQFEELNDRNGVVDTYLHMCESFLTFDKPDSALIYANKAMEICRKMGRDDNLSYTLEVLSRINSRMGNHNEALRLLCESNALSDSLRNAESHLRLDDWEHFNVAIEEAAGGAKSRPIAWGWITAIFFTASTILLIILLIKKLRQLESARQTADERDLLYRETIDKVNRQMTTLSLEKLKLHEGLGEVHEGLRHILMEINPRDNAKRENIRSMLAQLNTLSTFDADEEFKLYFEQVHPNFYQMLTSKHQELTPRDLRLCAFIYLGLTTKEIASLTYREIRSVESARNRLRKKLNLSVNDDITAYLRGFV